MTGKLGHFGKVDQKYLESLIMWSTSSSSGWHTKENKHTVAFSVEVSMLYVFA
jgi:hypothetical protein